MFTDDDSFENSKYENKLESEKVSWKLINLKRNISKFINYILN